ncbi:MAG: OmpA family protein [Bdellovibrionales bacterium]|nr:OmpA family protein [Bdellovibrionales bacterium]
MSFTNSQDFPMLTGMNRTFLPAIAILFVCGIQTRAAPLRTTYSELPGKKQTREVYPDLSRKNWWLFASLDLGGINYSSRDAALVGSRSGFALGGRLLVSRHSENFVIDGGLGWRLISASGVNPTNSNTKDTISSKVPYLDFSVRYRISERFQLGPEFEFWLGTDNGLNRDNLSTETNNGKFIGVEGVYEWDRHRKHRIGARVLTSVGVSSRTVIQYLAFYQISFDVFGEGEKVEPEPLKSYEQVTPSDLERAESLTPSEPIPMTPKSSNESQDQNLGYSEPAPDVMSTPAPPEENVEPEATPAPVSNPEGTDVSQRPVLTKRLVLTLGTNDLPFGQADAKLPLAHQARIRNIGKYLFRNQGAWKRLDVSAHTDERGDEKKNKTISLKRAELIRKLLMEGGVPGKRIRSFGLGESMPLARGNSEKAWSRNRRVELQFSDVKDSSLIKRCLEQ